MTEPIDTSLYRMKSGRHHGQPIRRVPVDYLQSLVLRGHAEAEIAAAELKRRGSVTPHLTITGHALDRASQTCLRIWKRTRQESEGLHTWLVRLCEEALKKRKRNALRGERITHQGLRLVFDFEGTWPVLMTVMRDEHSDPRTPRDTDEDEGVPA